MKAKLQISARPSCGSERIRKTRRNWTGTAERQRYTVPCLQFYECPACGERVYDAEAMRRIEAKSPAFSTAHRHAMAV